MFLLFGQMAIRNIRRNAGSLCAVHQFVIAICVGTAFSPRFDAVFAKRFVRVGDYEGFIDIDGAPESVAHRTCPERRVKAKGRIRCIGIGNVAGSTFKAFGIRPDCFLPVVTKDVDDKLSGKRASAAFKGRLHGLKPARKIDRPQRKESFPRAFGARCGFV